LFPKNEVFWETKGNGIKRSGPKIWFKNFPFPKIWFLNQILGKFKNQILGKGKGKAREQNLVFKTKFCSQKTKFFGKQKGKGNSLRRKFRDVK
jgi:hypothetical protein